MMRSIRKAFTYSGPALLTALNHLLVTFQASQAPPTKSTKKPILATMGSEQADEARTHCTPSSSSRSRTPCCHRPPVRRSVDRGKRGPMDRLDVPRPPKIAGTSERRPTAASRRWSYQGFGRCRTRDYRARGPRDPHMSLTCPIILSKVPGRPVTPRSFRTSRATRTAALTSTFTSAFGGSRPT